MKRISRLAGGPACRPPHPRFLPSIFIVLVVVVVEVATPDDIDDSFVRRPNGLTVPFELRREVVPAKLQLQLQHLLAPVHDRLPLRMAGRRFRSRFSAVRLIPAGYCRLLKSREVRRVSPPRRYIQGSTDSYVCALVARRLVYRALTVGSFLRSDMPDSGCSFRSACFNTSPRERPMLFRDTLRSYPTMRAILPSFRSRGTEQSPRHDICGST